MDRGPARWIRTALPASLALAVLCAASVGWRAAKALRKAAEDVRAAHEIRFSARPWSRASNPGFELVSAPRVFSQAATFRQHLFVAGPAGLLEFDPSGRPIQQFSVGIDLPGSPLIAVASAVLADTHEQELVLATANDGLLAFNGRSFRQILPLTEGARAITTILPSPSGHLLIGTQKNGVLVYDGKQIAVLHSSLDALYVTAMAGDESDLWVGTLDRGVLHFHAGTVESFDEGHGVADPQVLSIARSGGSTYVGTANGIAVFDDGRFSRVLRDGLFASSLFAAANSLYVGTEDQGVIVLPLDAGHKAQHTANAPQMLEVRQFFTSGDDLYAVARGGIYRQRGLAWDRVLENGKGILQDRNVSALAADADGQLWVGYFDRGLDVVAADSSRSHHVEDDRIFCVNRILPESRTNTVDVATANGLVRFDRFGNEQQVLTRADGLIADHVTDIVDYHGGLALATPAGLTFLDSSGARSMYAFHGLVNNHVYALGAFGDDLMAGTLGGLSQLRLQEIRTNYTMANSNLRANWITAVARVGSEWMVGTYGAGVLALDESGRFRPFETGSGAFEVNPNALLVRPDFVLAGSLGHGLYVYDRASSRWHVVQSGLPSLNVTAFTAANGYIYVGTDNGLVRIPEQKLHL